MSGQDRDKQTAAIDPIILIELRQLDETGEVLSTLIASFLERAPRLQERMRAAWYQHDAKVLAETAHELKGSGSNFGAWRIRQVCDRIEAFGRNDELATIGECLAQLDAEFLLVRTALLQAQEQITSPRRSEQF